MGWQREDARLPERASGRVVGLGHGLEDAAWEFGDVEAEGIAHAGLRERGSVDVEQRRGRSAAAGRGRVSHLDARDLALGGAADERAVRSGDRALRALAIVAAPVTGPVREDVDVQAQVRAEARA